MPKRVALLTDFVVIGTAGPTIDGRTITDQMLKDMAETYDPETYTAVINSDHLLGLFGSFGQVRETRLGKNKHGKLTLEARLEPNLRLMDMNTRGQRLFTSMEVSDDFADTGKMYLSGLALTDNPASLGTTELRFQKAAEKGQYRAQAVEISGDIFTVSDATHSSTPEEAETPGTPDPGVLRKFAHYLLSLCGQASTHSNAQPGTPQDMTPEEVKALVGQEFTAFKAEITAMLKPEEGKGKETAAPPEKPSETPASPEGFAKLATAVEDQGKAIIQLTTQLTDALNKVANGNAGGQQTGAAQEPDVL